MQAWENLLHVALLGTDKKKISPSDLPEEISILLNDTVQASGQDKEEQFLQIAALLFNYRQCGTEPARGMGANLPVAEEEEKEYAGEQAHRVLQDILFLNSYSLLQLWLKRASITNQLVQPEWVPALLDLAVKQTTLREDIKTCVGKRGQWLAQFNKEWCFWHSVSDEELWQTGTQEQRRQLLLELRKKDPARARAFLQQVWLQESAAAKVEFLQLMSATVVEQDKEWLTSLLQEKSTKVKELALQLLKTIPQSDVVQQYQKVLEQSVFFDKEKRMFGFSSKLVLKIELPPIEDESLFKTGIEKLSNTKTYSDEEFILLQLIGQVPPYWWEQHLKLKPEEIIALFKANSAYSKYLVAFPAAISRFKDKEWAIAFAEAVDSYYEEVLSQLPFPQFDAYAIKHMEQNAFSIISHAQWKEEEWSLSLTRAIVKQTAASPYQFNRSFYNEHIQLIPVDIVPELGSFAPEEPYLKDMWERLTEYLIQLLQLKTDIKKAFTE